MRCLVIGGNGFIGSHVVDELVVMGHEVTVLDRFSRPQKYESSPVRKVAGDFLNRGDLAIALRGQDVVYHLLSMSTPVSAEADPLIDVRTNVVGSIEMLQLAADNDIETVYFASSGGAIYGDRGNSVGAVDESVAPQPVSPYAIGKLTIERYLEFFRRTRGLRSVVFRISNPYGPRQDPMRKQGVIPIYLRNLHRGDPIVVYGDGSMERDYVFIEDLARMIVAPLGRSAPHNLYNVGSGVSHSLAEIVDAVQRASGTKARIEYREAPPTFVNRIALSVDRYRRDFGEVTPLASLDEGICRTWAGIVSEVD